MKAKYIRYFVGAVAIAFTLTGCSDILDENPRNIYDPGFYDTPEGVTAGLTGLYAGLRDVYGQPYYYGAVETGTDEYTYGGQADNNFKAADLAIPGLIPDADNSRFDVLWGQAFYAINNASQIIENGTKANMDPALLAEAHFFRAFWYFQLVQAFGGVPLDLGGGELIPNTAPSKTSVRNTVPEVYTKAIFPDLLEAVKSLPDNPRLTGTAAKEAARLVLAKAYLTYGWWLENPNNIPTYPAAERVDPDGVDAHGYFQEALDMAKEGIANSGSYGLMDTYYDLNNYMNDRNKEILLYADHTEFDSQHSDQNTTPPEGGGYNGSPSGNTNAENEAVWMVTWYFQSIMGTGGGSPFFRSVLAGQSYSRMWGRMSPSADVFMDGGAFSPANIGYDAQANTNVDSRFDGTFTSVYRATYALNGTTANGSVKGANGITLMSQASPATAKIGNNPGDYNTGDPAVTFLQQNPGGISYPADNGTATDVTNAVGMLPNRGDYVVPLTSITRNVNPGLWKLGPARTQTNYNQDLYDSPRPFNILKFSEFYFIAAEAAVKLNNQGEARGNINVIRARAGRQNFNVSTNEVVNVDNSAAMIAATPATIDINYILDERMREYFGEGIRWFDLARTQTWAQRAGVYHIGETKPVGGLKEVPRDVLLNETYLYLRPIPTGQLNLLDVDSKEGYQNPGYDKPATAE